MEIIQRLVIFITLQRIILALELRTIYQISNKLDIKQPCIISNNKSELQIMKYFCHYNSYITPSCPNGVFEKDEIEFNMMNTIILTDNSGLFIINNENFQDILRKINTTIDKKIFILNENTLELFETYEINSIKIEKKIAQIIIDDAANQISLDWTENSYFTKRRSDFQGLILNGLTDEEGSSITLNSNYCNLSKTFGHKNSSYFNVTGYVSGIYYEVLQLLQSRLNFTTNLSKRQDGRWGTVTCKQTTDSNYNESAFFCEGIGMVGDVYFQNADIIVAPLAIISTRIPYIDFLNPITFEKFAIYIPRNDLSEKFSLATFTGPFNTEMWVGLFVFVLVIACNKLLTFYFHQITIYNYDILEAFWASFATYCGGYFQFKESNNTNEKWSYKITIFTSLLCGNIVWLGYQAFLVAELAVFREVYPFSDLGKVYMWSIYSVLHIRGYCFT